MRNAATTTASPDSDDESFERPFKAQVNKGPVYQLQPRKPKFAVRRRATISGSSPTTVQPPIRIEDLVSSSARAKKDQLGRSTSHDATGKTLSATRLVHKVPYETPRSPKTKCVPPANNNNDQFINNNSSSNDAIAHTSDPQQHYKTLPTHHTNGAAVPYAKVQPLPVTEREPDLLESAFPETIPKQIMCTLKPPLVHDPVHIYETVHSENEADVNTDTTGIHTDGLKQSASPPVPERATLPPKPALPAKPAPLAHNVGVVIPSHTGTSTQTPPPASNNGTLTRETPTPRPRVSKLGTLPKKEKVPADSPPPLLPKAPIIVGAMKKPMQPQLCQSPSAQLINSALLTPQRAQDCPSSPDSIFTPQFEHVVPKEHGARLAIAVDENIFKDDHSGACTSPESGYLSILDKEYNRLFGSSSQDSLRSSNPLRSATTPDVPALCDRKPVCNTRSSESDSGVNLRSISSSHLNRNHSPTSDNSLSSSSGISSYYSAYLELPPKPKPLQSCPAVKLPPKPAHMRQVRSFLFVTW